MDDWEKVTKEHKLTKVPAKAPVTQLLNEYYESESNVRRPGSADADILEEVIAGIKEYFNKALGRLLLYRFERQQYFEVHKQIESGHHEHAGKNLCDLYGCEYLLRLFGKQQYNIRSREVSELILSSDFARSHRPHQHGLRRRQPVARGTDETDTMDGETYRTLPQFQI